MKTVTVLGASGGLGKAVVTTFKENGYQVNELTRDDFDISNGNLPIEMIPFLNADVVVNCIGHFGYDYDSTMNINFKFNWSLIEHYLSMNRRETSIKVILIGSRTIIRPSPKWTIYSCSKIALNALVQAKSELMFSKNIFLNIIHPPSIDTKMRWDALGFREDGLMSPLTVAERIFNLSQGDTTGQQINL